MKTVIHEGVVNYSCEHASICIGRRAVSLTEFAGRKVRLTIEELEEDDENERLDLSDLYDIEDEDDYPSINSVDFDIELLEELDNPKDHFGWDADLNFVLDGIKSGNPWAWCTVKVIASWEDYSGCAYLRACSYESREDFVNGGYYCDLEQEAYEDLCVAIDRVKN